MFWLRTTEIAGKKILAMPLEAIAFTPEQQKKFEEAGGLMNPVVEVAIAAKNQDKMMCWTESFETLESEINGTLYEGFELFKKVYEAFLDIAGMTREEAMEVGIYPTIYYRNFAARKWMAEIHGGHLAHLDDGYNGELSDIYNATLGKTRFQKLAIMGQAPLGWRDAGDAKVYGLGDWVLLGSGSLDAFGYVRGLNARRRRVGVGNYWDWQGTAMSSVVVLND